MSEEQQQFFAMLESYPTLKRFWDQDSMDVDLKAVKKSEGYLSSGEFIALQVLTSIWLGTGTMMMLKIDFTDLAVLSPDFRRPFVEWLCQPFYP